MPRASPSDEDGILVYTIIAWGDIAKQREFATVPKYIK